MGLSHNLQSACRKILCQVASRQETITYGELARQLGLPSAQQQWNTILNPIASSERHDLTLVVVYASGPAKGLSRYFSNIRGGEPPQTAKLEPSNPQQVASYKRDLAAVWAHYRNAPC